MYLTEGFPGQRLYVLPGPLTEQAAKRPPTSRLLVTDAGYFPHAAKHGRDRGGGALQTVVIMCAEGAGWCELAGVRHEIVAGQVLILPSQLPHRYYADTDRPWSIWWLHISGDDVAELLGCVGLTVEQPVGTMIEPTALFALAENICDCLARDETWASLTAAAGAGWNLLARLAAERERRTVSDTEPLRRVQDHLRENLSSVVSVPALAAMAGFSTSHFSARFRAGTGFSVLEYIKRLRMARARQLLITSSHSVAEIAAAVGYPDPFYFSRQFRAVNGVGPRDFRARALEEWQP